MLRLNATPTERCGRGCEAVHRWLKSWTAILEGRGFQSEHTQHVTLQGKCMNHVKDGSEGKNSYLDQTGVSTDNGLDIAMLGCHQAQMPELTQTAPMLLNIGLLHGTRQQMAVLKARQAKGLRCMYSLGRKAETRDHHISLFSTRPGQPRVRDLEEEPSTLKSPFWTRRLQSIRSSMLLSVGRSNPLEMQNVVSDPLMP